MQDEEKLRNDEKQPEEMQEEEPEAADTIIIIGPVPTGGMVGGEEPGIKDTAPDVDSGDLPTGSRGIPGVSAPNEVEEETPESEEDEDNREVPS